MLRVRDVSIAEDLVQETFLAALKSRESFKGQAAEKSWLIGILKHKIMDHYRKNSRDQNLNQHVTDEKGFESFFSQQIKESHGRQSWGDDPSKNAENEEFRTVFQKCLKNIPPKLAQVFTMRELDNMPTEEICKELNISPTNLWVILHRARMGLKNCLETNWFNAEKGSIK
jgi:RNA polymerase sigma-70 factor (ECF subfamily)